MDITFLSPKSAMPSRGKLPMGKGVEEGYIPPGMEKPAPPGAAPPLTPASGPMGEEGAKLEPNAPTQTPDFFPNFIDPALNSLDASSAFESEGESGFKPLRKGPVPLSLECLVDPGMKSLELMSALGPIFVAMPNEPASDNAPASPVGPGFEVKSLEVVGLPSSDGTPPSPASIDPDIRSSKLSASNAESKSEKSTVGPMPPEPIEAKSEKEQPVPVPPIETEAGKSLRKSHRREDYMGQSKELRAIAESGLASIDSATESAKPTDSGASKTSAENTTPKPPEAIDSPQDRNAKGGEEKSGSNGESSDSLLSRKEIIEAKESRVAAANAAVTDSDLDASLQPNNEPPQVPVSNVAAARESSAVEPKPKVELSTEQSATVLRQVADRLEALAAGNAARRVTIQLEPENFGHITLVVRQRGSDVEAEVYATNDAVRAAMESHRPMLASSLEQRGIQLGSMTVGHELPNESGRQEQAMREAARDHAGQAPLSRRDEEGLTLEAMRSLSRQATGVDLWI